MVNKYSMPARLKCYYFASFKIDRLKAPFFIENVCLFVLVFGIVKGENLKGRNLWKFIKY